MTKKESVIIVFTALATLSTFFNGIFQNNQNDLQNNLFIKIGNVAAHNSNLSANSAEIILQKGILEWCYNNNRNDCGSSDILMREAVLGRDAIRANDIDAVTDFNEFIKTYSQKSNLNNIKITVSNFITFLFLISTIFITVKKEKH